MTKVILIPSFSRFGGTRTYFEQLLQFYDQEKVDLVVALTAVQINDGGAELVNSYGFKLYKMPERSKKFRSVLWRTPFNLLFDLVIGLYLMLKFKPDVMVISEGNPGSFIGMFILPIRIIYILHTYPMGNMRWPVRVLLNSCLSDRKVILTVSEFAKRNILQFWVSFYNSDYVKVIYHSVGESASYEKTNSDSKLTILTLGHVAAYKNPYFWIEVAKKVIQELPEQVQFFWAGEGELLCDCLKRVEALNIPNIKFIGFVDDVNTLYAESDIYFQPSLIESLSLSVLDAMRWGLPCLVSVNGGLPETVINNETGFVVDVNSVDSTFKKIVQLVLDSKLRNEMGKAARLYYENKFSQDKWSKDMETIHHEIMI